MSRHIYDDDGHTLCGYPDTDRGPWPMGRRWCEECTYRDSYDLPAVLVHLLEDGMARCARPYGRALRLYDGGVVAEGGRLADIGARLTLDSGLVTCRGCA